MTIITLSENSIEIQGHSPEKIVCHGVSAICNMVANYVIDNHWGKAIAREGYVKIYDIEEEYIDDHLFKAMIDALIDIQAEYPNNIQINYM